MEIVHRIPTVEEYLALRDTTTWWKVDSEALRNALENTLYSVLGVDGDRVVAMGRVVGDGSLYFYLQDLIVHPEYQSRGLGRQLMMEMMAYVESHASSGSYAGLMAARGLESYYEAFGFRARPVDAPGMGQVYS